jgi:probable HAF family extracellular repeat protein
MPKANRLAFSVLVVLSLAAFAAAQSYTITDLGQFNVSAINSLGDVVINNPTYANSFVLSPDGGLLHLAPLPGDCCTSPYGLNGQGLAVGASNNSNTGVFLAVLWTNGEPLDLGTLPGANDCWATAISESGVVSGYCYIPTGIEAFLWTKATGMQGLGFLPGAAVSVAKAINRFGQVAGYSGAHLDVESGKDSAFIWSKTTGIQSLGKLPGYDSSGAYAINDLGQVAGESACISCRLEAHATLWSKAKGSMLDLGVLPGFMESTATGINNVGQVIGSSYNGNVHAFVWSPSTGMLDLNNLIPANSGWALVSANAINDQGQIVGYGLHYGKGVGFLLTPQ